MRSVARVPPLDRPATYDDLVKLPDNLVAEIVDGELHASPRPTPRHAVTETAVGMLLGNPFHFGRGGPGGWWILVEPVARTLEVLRLEAGRWVIVSSHEGSETVRAEPFDEVELTLSDLWVD